MLGHIFITALQVAILIFLVGYLSLKTGLSALELIDQGYFCIKLKFLKSLLQFFK